MDPSEIIKVPYDLNRLCIFVSVPCVSLLFVNFVNEPMTLMKYIVTVIRFALITYAMMGLCGANIVENYQHSICCAMYVSSLLVTTVTNLDNPTGKIFEQLPFYSGTNTGGGGGSMLVPKFRLYSMLLMIIPFQILQILDWGGQIQRWPVPIILGVSYGYVVGTLCGILANYVIRQSNNEKSKRKKDNK